MIIKFIYNNREKFIALLLVIFIFILLLTIFSSNKKRQVNSLNVNEYTWLNNQFPLLLNSITGAYTFECLHTSTSFKNYKILENVNVKASIECIYIDQSLTKHMIFLPVAIEIIQETSRNIQFLAGFSSSGIYENSQLTETAITNIVNNQVGLSKIGNRIITKISHPNLLINGNSGFTYTSNLFVSDKISSNDFFSFSNTGDPKEIEIRAVDGMSVIFAESIYIKNN